MIAYFFLIVGIVALLFPYDTEDLEQDRSDTTSLMANLGGEGVALFARIIGGFLVFLGITMVFMDS